MASTILKGESDSLLKFNPFCFWDIPSLLQNLTYKIMGYFNSFYIGNTLLVLVYPIHRLLYNINSMSLYKKDTFGFTYENSIIYMMLTLLTLNYIRSYSMPQFITDTVTDLVMLVCAA